MKTELCHERRGGATNDWNMVARWSHTGCLMKRQFAMVQPVGSLLGEVLQYPPGTLLVTVLIQRQYIPSAQTVFTRGNGPSMIAYSLIYPRTTNAFPTIRLFVPDAQVCSSWPIQLKQGHYTLCTPNNVFCGSKYSKLPVVLRTLLFLSRKLLEK